MSSLGLVIEKLIYYGRKHLDLNELDALYLRNILLNKFNLSAPDNTDFDHSLIDNLLVPDTLINELKEALIEKGLENAELLVTEVMGLISPLPSIVQDKVLSLEKEKPGLGLDYLFNLQIKNYYIQKTAIDRNIYFKKEYGDNFLEITINLSKPEKNNKDIAKLLTKTPTDKFPRCLLCKENLGYGGRKDHPCRTNIRIVPFLLNDEKWFLQYSPYAYFDHHAIIINENHHNMIINEGTFKKLLEFVDKFPTFFIGSNADLPIVGGSILDHEHYQGGLHLLPMFYAKDREIIYQKDNLKISILEWYNSVIKIESTKQEEILLIANKILNNWINYDNEEIDIISHSGDIRHSTITPLARKIGNKFALYLILRNNRTNEKYPEGIFHAHPKYHHIKQEGIGLIEATGLFILPPRLKRQMGYIKEILSGSLTVSEAFNKYEDLAIHQEMVTKLVDLYGLKNSLEKANEVINDYLAKTCQNILKNTAVFKNTEVGNKYFKVFIESCLK